jgi:hypothetical protein
MSSARLLLLVAAVSVGGCGGSQGSMPGPPQGGGPPAVSVVTGEVTIPASGAQVTLPADSVSGDSLSATFPMLAASISVQVTTTGGPADATPPTASIWSPNCPWPLEDVQFVFASAQSFSAVPSLTFTSPRIVGSPTYYYDEIFDADSSSMSPIAAQKVSTASSWPAQTAILPSMPIQWSAISGHRYIIEIVPSNATNSCT